MGCAESFCALNLFRIANGEACGDQRQAVQASNAFLRGGVKELGSAAVQQYCYECGLVFSVDEVGDVTSLSVGRCQEEGLSRPIEASEKLLNLSFYEPAQPSSQS